MDYPLNFFEAMEAVNEGKKVINEWAQNSENKERFYFKDENGAIKYYAEGFFNDNPEGFFDGYEDIQAEELLSKWRIVGKAQEKVFTSEQIEKINELITIALYEEKITNTLAEVRMEDD